MLGKIIKNEWIATAKILIPVHIILLVISLIGRLELSMGILNSENRIMEIISTLMVIVYILAVLAAAFITMIYLVVRFYKSMFTDEGYLTFTLPAKPMTILNGKLIVGFLWILLDTVVVIASILLIVWNAKTASAVSEALPLLIDELEQTGMSVSGLLGFWGVTMAVGIVSSVLAVVAAITIGQLSNKHKVAFSVLAYFVIYIIREIVDAIFLVGELVVKVEKTTVITSELEDAEMAFTVNSLVDGILWQQIVISIVFAIVYYVVSNYIIQRKLNLE